MNQSTRGENRESLYGPMVDVLLQRFGVEFELWDTGGGCTALVGEFGDDLSVYITDAPNSSDGREATITDQPTRRQVRGHGGTVGFAVGVYRDAGQIQVAYEEYPTAVTAHLPELVSDQLTAAIREKCGICNTVLDYNGEITKLDVQVWNLNRATGEKKQLCPACGDKLQAFLKGELT